MSASARTAVEWAWRCRRSVLAAGVVLLLLGGFVLWKNTAGSAVAVNPWMPGSRWGLALLLVHQQALADCGPQCEAWLRLDPASTKAHTLGARCRAS